MPETTTRRERLEAEHGKGTSIMLVEVVLPPTLGERDVREALAGTALEVKVPTVSLTSLLEDARQEMLEDDAHWTREACGQDTEEAEESGRLAGYAEGLEAALKVLEP